MITTPSSTQHKTLAFLQTLARNKIYNKKTLLEKLYVLSWVTGYVLTSSFFVQKKSATQVFASRDEALGELTKPPGAGGNLAASWPETTPLKKSEAKKKKPTRKFFS